MRHRKQNKKLGRSKSHRKATLAALVSNLILQERIKTTQAKAKLARSFAEKMVTLARKGTLAARRQAIAALCDNRQNKAVHKLFEEIAPRFTDRPGGYTRIIKLGTRVGDGSDMVLLEWVELGQVAATPAGDDSTDKKGDKAEDAAA